MSQVTITIILVSKFVLKVIFTHCIPLHELNCIDYGWNIVSNKVEIVGTFLS